jgi:hypothetical protein
MRRVNRRAGIGSLKSIWTGNGVSSYTSRGPTFRGRFTVCSASPREPKCAVTWSARLRTLSPINPHSAIVLRRVPKSYKESGNADGGPSTGPDGGALGSDQGERGQLGRPHPSYGKRRQWFRVSHEAARSNPCVSRCMQAILASPVESFISAPHRHPKNHARIPLESTN